MYVNEELRKLIEKGIKAELLLEAVLENDEMDLYEERCKVSKAKYAGYCESLRILESLHEKGCCDYEAANIEKPYTLHTIYVKWILCEGDRLCIDSKIKHEVIELLKCTEECLIDEDTAGTWQLSSRIYIPVRELE